MNQEEVESQLSAMFDGELPAAECELLSRRIDRDPELRARWSRYAVIGAVMRAEPVTAVRGDFSQRVSAVLAEQAGRGVRTLRRRRHHWRTASLAASLVAGVAGMSILLLRDVSGISVPVAAMHAGTAAEVARVVAGSTARAAGADPGNASQEPLSYVTPTVHSRPTGFGLATQLADYVVAHSEYSTPLTRRNLLSALMTAEEADGADAPDTNTADDTAARTQAQVPDHANQAGARHGSQ